MQRPLLRLLVTATFAVLCLLSVPASARAAGELNLFAWSEYVPQDVIDGFTKETGVKVNYETYASNEEMLHVLDTGLRLRTPGRDGAR